MESMNQTEKLGAAESRDQLMMHIIVRNLKKSSAAFQASKNVSFEIEKG